MSFKDVVSLSAQDFNMLWRAIDVLESQEHISHCRALLYPSMKRQARVERDKKLYAAAYPRDIYKKEAKSASFLVDKLGGKRG
jgi:hypothetical protein